MAVDHRTETIVVAEANAGERLDRALAVAIADLSRSRLKALILAGEVTIGGRTVRDPGHRVNAGDAVTVALPPPEPAAPAPENIPLNIVFEDDEIIVIDKPRGMVVHPAAGKTTGTLVNALIAHCGASLSGIGGVRRPGIVHRLDKDTTGLMVVAKTDRAHAKLAAQFADHGRTGPLRRGYLAFVWGVPDRPRGTIDAADRPPPARPRQDGGPRRAAAKRSPIGRCWSAILGTDGKPVASLLACRLETGRTHQIRVHLAHAGHPLIGDSVYGPGFRTKIARLAPEAAAAVEALGRQALHAYLLTIEHPVTGQALEFRSELPGDLGSFTSVSRCPGYSGTEDGAQRARQIKDLTLFRWVTPT